MRAQNVFSTATAFLFEQAGEDADFKKHAPALINLLVAEALPHENTHRAALGQSELESAPVITTLDDDIPYCEEICRIALPFGLASYFYQDECDNYKAQDYRARYIDALNEASKAIPTDVQDEYGTEE